MTDAVFISGIENTRDVVKKNSLIIIFSSVFVLGILFGSFSISFCNDSSCFGIDSIFNGYYQFISTNDLFSIFTYTFLSYFFMLFLSYVLGLCALGVFFGPLILFFVGFGSGITSGYLYFMYALNGICFFSLILLPGLFLFFITFIVSVKQSFLFSKKLFKLIIGNDTKSLLSDFKKLSLKFGIYIFGALIFALLNAGLSTAFSGFFKF